MSGPQFLLLYLGLALVANIGLRWHFRRVEAAYQAPPMEFAQDPYQIAFLRNGLREAVVVALVNLVDRGLLEERSGEVRQTRADAQELARRPLEQAILRGAATWQTPEDLFKNSDVLAACRDYEAHLGARRLLADARTRAERLTPFAIALFLMTGLALARIVNALLHGRHNIGFLIILTMACAIGLLVAYRRRLTGLGDATLHKLQTLFARLRRSGAVPGGANTDAVLLAAVFGIAALPAEAFPYAARLNPKPQSSSDSGGGDSSSSSDSGGCGGGGCGGGCGG